MTAAITPARIATKVAKVTDFAWTVVCEGDGCTNQIIVAKREYAPSGGVTEFTDPGARRCVRCGPFDSITR